MSKQILLEKLIGTFSRAECHVPLVIINSNGKLLFVKVSQNNSSAFLDCRKTTNVVVGNDGDSSERSFIVLVGRTITTEIPQKVLCTKKARVSITDDNECISVEGRCLQLFEEEAWTFFKDEKIEQDYEFPNEPTVVEYPLTSFKLVYDMAKDNELTSKTFPKLIVEETVVDDVIEEDDHVEEKSTSTTTNKGEDNSKNDEIPNGTNSYKDHLDIPSGLNGVRKLSIEITEIINRTISNLEKEYEEINNKLKDTTDKLSKVKSIKKRRPNAGKQLASTDKRFTDMKALLEQQKSELLVQINNFAYMQNMVIDYIIPEKDD